MEFLEARKVLLAEEANRRMTELLHGDVRWMEGPAAAIHPVLAVGSGISSEAERDELMALNNWVEAQGLPKGELAYNYVDPNNGQLLAVIDLAWPTGLQSELSDPVAVLLNETDETLAIASGAGFRCFRSVEDFKVYAEREILAGYVSV